MHQRTPRFDPRLVDAAVVAAVAAVGVMGLVVLVIAQVATARMLAVGTVLALGQAGVLWWRRRSPLGVLGATLVVLLVAQAVGDVNAAAFAGPHAAAYAVGAFGSRRAAVIGLVGVGLAAAVDFVIAHVVPAALPYGTLLLTPTGAFVVIAWGVGRYVRVRREYLDTLVAYSHQLESERDEKIRSAVLDERRRIARELHDQVAHHLGVAALHTGAARTWMDRDRERAAFAMGSAEDAVRAALTTMPVILDALRNDHAGEDFAPQPTVADVEELVEKVAATGLAVDLHVGCDRDELSAPVDLAAYRIVQEALTNTLKHADASRAEVNLRFTPERLEVEVTDDGTGAGTSGGGAGLGLVGMRERVELLGGDLFAGPVEGGGFTVRASLPRAPSPERA